MIWSFVPQYSISRSFPYRGRTWAAIAAVGVALTILFTFIAVATNAYDFQSVYVSEPNGTLADRPWYQKQPFSTFGAKSSICQDSVLTVGQQYLTRNKGFVYSLDRISNDTDVFSQAQYHDQTLESCNLNYIRVDFTRLTQASNKSDFWTWGGTKAKASVGCIIHTPTPVNLTFVIDLPTADAPVGERAEDIFLTTSRSPNTAMWLGIQVTMAWYRQLPIAFGYLTSTNDPWDSGTVVLRRNLAVTDYHSLDFFNVSPAFRSRSGNLVWLPATTTMQGWKTNSFKEGLPDITVTIDAFSKSFHALTMADFGVAANNALNSPSGIQYLQEIVDQTALNNSAACPIRVVCAAGNIERPYTDYSIPIPGINSTRLETQYLCSVSSAKSTASILYAVIIAELVFLQASWTLFSLIASWWLGSHDESSNYCVGCLAQPSMSLKDFSAGSSASRFRSKFSSKQTIPHSVSSNSIAQPLLP